MSKIGWLSEDAAFSVGSGAKQHSSTEVPGNSKKHPNSTNSSGCRVVGLRRRRDHIVGGITLSAINDARGFRSAPEEHVL